MNNCHLKCGETIEGLIWVYVKPKRGLVLSYNRKNSFLSSVRIWYGKYQAHFTPWKGSEMGLGTRLSEIACEFRVASFLYHACLLVPSIQNTAYIYPRLIVWQPIQSEHCLCFTVLLQRRNQEQTDSILFGCCTHFSI